MIDRCSIEFCGNGAFHQVLVHVLGLEYPAVIGMCVTHAKSYREQLGLPDPLELAREAKRSSVFAKDVKVASEADR